MRRAGFFGKIALEKEMVREPEILKALEMQLEYERQGKRVPRLGEALVAMGAMTADQVREVLRYQHTMYGELPEISPISSQQEQKEQPAPADTPEGRDEDCGLSTGDVFANYKLMGKVGSGEMGSAWQAKHENGGKPVLLRVFSREVMDVPWAKDFDHQVIRATKLEHPGIQRIIRGGLHEGKYYYISELDQGKSLRSLLEERGALELSVITELAVHLCAALQYGHGREMFHNHISPTSIMVNQGFEVKLTAYGMVPDPVGSLNRMAQEVGDIPFYVAPELVIAEGDTSVCGTWSDFYSVGAVLFHCLTGVPPFHGLSTEEVLTQMYDLDKVKEMLVDAEIDQDVCKIVLALMDCDPQQRIKTAGELMVALSPLRDKYKFSATGWNKPVRGKFFPGRKSKDKAEEISRPRNFNDFGGAKARNAPTRTTRTGSGRSKTGGSSRSGRSSTGSGISNGSASKSSRTSGASSSSSGAGSRRRSERRSARRSARDRAPAEPVDRENRALRWIAAGASLILVSLFSYQVWLTATSREGVLDTWFNFDKKIESVARQMEQEKERAHQAKLAREFAEKQRIASEKKAAEDKIRKAEEEKKRAELAKMAEEDRIRKVAAELIAEQQKGAAQADNAEAKPAVAASAVKEKPVGDDDDDDGPALNFKRRGGNFLRDPDAE